MWQETRPTRVVVTGGAGFLGSWVCEQLLAEGAHVVCVDSYLTGARANVEHLLAEDRFELVEEDVTLSLDIAGDVDSVLHLASPASPADYLRLPLETLRVGSVGTTHALELALRTGARFVLASTSEVYGDPRVHPQPETYWGNVNPIGPRSVYDEAKRFAEALTSAYRRTYGLDTGIVRIFNTYGPRMRTDDGRVVPTFLAQAMAGRPLTVAGTGTQTRSLCYAEDTAAGIIAMARSHQPGPVNIGGGEELTILQIAERIRALCGSDSPIEFVPRPEDDPELRRPDTRRAEELLGWRARVSADDGLARTLTWLRRQIPQPRRAPGAAPRAPAGLRR